MDAAAALAAYTTLLCGAAEVEVHAVAVAPSVLEHAEDLKWTGDPCSPTPVLRLEVVEQGAVVARYTVRPSMTIRIHGWVAASTAEAGEAVPARRDLFILDRTTGRAIDGGGPWRARVALAEGTPLSRAVVDPLPDAPRGQPVTLRVIRGAVTLTADGALLEDGTVGEEARARNEATQSTVQGVLVAPDILEIR
ncbi:MAG: flagella basal body P-ring formation protein FlgA [Myxococcales bacterium]|nr:flagella basal body P-ring formation protein FlgA [Myxococcales bacterium]